MTTLLPNGKQQFFSASGVPLAGGSVFFYIPGTTTFKNTWQDSSQVTLNTNPVILDAAGEAVIFGSGAYRQIVQDSIGNVIWDQLTSSTDQGGFYSGGVSTGTAANQILAVTVPAGFALVIGNAITFIAGFTSTGPTTLNANATGAKNILKPGASGLAALVASDIVVGNAVQLFWDGTQYQMLSAPVTIGAGLAALAGVTVSNELVNAQTGTTYAIVNGDRAKLVTRTNALAMADTLPNANTLGAGGWYVDVSVLPASVGTLTITPTTSTIAGAATLALTPGTGVRIVSDGTNYQVQQGQGRIAQIVNTLTGAVATGTTVIPNDNTIPQQSGSPEGDQYMSLPVTPSSASSILLIDVVIYVSSSQAAAGAAILAALFQDSTASALAAATVRQAATTSLLAIVFRHKMTAGTTSLTTFKVRAGGGAAGTTTFNGEAGAQLMGGVMPSSITITEVLP